MEGKNEMASTLNIYNQAFDPRIILLIQN